MEKKNYYQETKRIVREMSKWEKCAFETCNNEVTAIGKKYCGKKDCPKIKHDKLKAKFGKTEL